MTKIFNAEEFVTNIIYDGDRLACDNTTERFKEFEKLPDFYNEEKFKRGQQFYHRNIFAMFFAKMLGLIISLALPKVNHILQLTNMSSEPYTAYKRYLSTIYHMCIWYDEDFYPGSILWKTLSAVKCKHNSASQRGYSVGLGQISQKDMAIAQFSFMGFAVTRTELIGIHNAKDEELEAFVHLWRVIGYLLGMDDRYNICRENINETKEICQLLINRIMKPELKKMDSSFIHMSSVLVKGMWTMNPVLEINVFLACLEKILNEDNRNSNELQIKLNFFQRVHLWLVCFTIDALKFNICRIYHNYNQYLTLWLMKHFPFLAYYKFGYVRSHVNVPSCNIDNK